MCIIIITNIVILYIVGRKTGNQNHGNPSGKAVLTISLVCWTFVLSYAPLMALYLPGVDGSQLPGWYQVIASNSPSINLIVNPVIYTFTNKRFAKFMKGLMRGKITALRSLARNSDQPVSSFSVTVQNADERSRSRGNIVIVNENTVARDI